MSATSDERKLIKKVKLHKHFHLFKHHQGTAAIESKTDFINQAKIEETGLLIINMRQFNQILGYKYYQKLFSLFFYDSSNLLLTDDSI